MKLTAIIEVHEYVPPQVVVCFKYTVVPASDKSLEDIVSEVVSNENQVREFADAYVPDDVLL
jgi:hypothetical protein